MKNLYLCPSRRKNLPKNYSGEMSWMYGPEAVVECRSIHELGTISCGFLWFGVWICMDLLQTCSLSCAECSIMFHCS